MSNLLSIKNVYKSYKIKNAEPVRAIDGLSLEVKKGEFLAVCGVSGSGKSTLLHLISGVLKPDSGEITVTEEDGSSFNLENMSARKAASYRNRYIGYVLQDFGLIPYRSVKENIAVPLYINGDPSGKINKKVDEIMDAVGIADLKKRKITELSGGQKQRVAIARALINSPQIILADEPTGALDSETKKGIIDLFRILTNSGKTVIMVTHDTEAASLCDRTVRIKDGKIYGI